MPCAGFLSEGVRCHPSGSLIAKPCTYEEVAFYESSALHPALRNFMPTFIGTLSSASQQSPLALAAVQESGATLLPGPQSQQASVPVAPIRHSAVSVFPSPTASTATPVPPPSDLPWVPSNGKKIETGISIVLENVASGFTRPNVVDVKLGIRLWADDAPPAKRTKLDAVSRETTSGNLGFRIAGMKVWTGVDGGAGGEHASQIDPYETKHQGNVEGARSEAVEKDGYRRYDKWYGRSLTDKTVHEGFRTFLAGARGRNGNVDRSRLVARRLADELRRIQAALEAEESRMYSSSVLIVYEGDPDALERALQEEQKEQEQALQPQKGDENDENDEDDEDDEDGDEFAAENTQDHLEGRFGIVELNGIPRQAVNIEIGPQLDDLGEDDEDEDEDEEEPPKVHDLRLIDFAHASWTPGHGPDENVLHGVRSLIKIFDELAEE